MERHEKAIAWLEFVGVFVLAFVLSLGVGILFRSRAAAFITYFVTLQWPW